MPRDLLTSSCISEEKMLQSSYEVCACALPAQILHYVKSKEL